MVEAVDKERTEMENKGQWWWVAERTRSKRLDYLRKAIWEKGCVGSGYLPGVKVDLHGPWCITRASKENEGDPRFLQKSKALAAAYDNMPIPLVDHSQIVGAAGSYPHTLAWIPDAAFIINEDLYNDRTVIPEPEQESLPIIREICNYWGSRTALTNVLRALPGEDVMKCMTGFIGWGIPLSSLSYATRQLGYIFEHGYNGIIQQIDERVAKAEEKLHKGVPSPEDYQYIEKLDIWKGMKITLEASIRHARRYSRLAKIVAENFETDAKRKMELLRIADTCNKVPAEPPEHLWESLQMDHFTFILESIEGANTWPCRMDYWHWPYYEKDVVKENSIPKDEALDLIGEFLIRTHEIGVFIPMLGRDTLQGLNTATFVGTLGGVNEDGSDACNDLTDCILEAARLVRVSNPTFGFRYHPRARTETLRQVYECIKQGLGYPSIRNDPVLIANSMHWYGHPLNEARRWVHQACMSPCPDTKWGSQPYRMASATVIAAKAIEYALCDGYDPVLNMQMGPHTGDASKFESFDALYEAWRTQITWLMDIWTRFIGSGRVLAEKYDPRPFRSSICERAVDLGVDSANPSERGNSWITFFAWMETGDSLAAVKKLIFDEGKYTMPQLLEALKANWDGYEDMRMDFVRAPKWGNDDEYVDQIHIRCHNDVAKHSREISDPMGNPWPVLPENVAAYVTNATRVGALPNGRRLGDTLYDGGCSPGAGMDKKGPTAVLRSVSKLDHIGTVRSTLLNQRLSPTQLQGEKGFQLWLNYIRTWAELGIDHVQFNCVDNETLRAAQKEPERYWELIVRIAGYSAHFVELNRKTQDTIVARTVQEL